MRGAGLVVVVVAADEQTDKTQTRTVDVLEKRNSPEDSNVSLPTSSYLGFVAGTLQRKELALSNFTY